MQQVVDPQDLSASPQHSSQLLCYQGLSYSVAADLQVEQEHPPGAWSQSFLFQRILDNEKLTPFAMGNSGLDSPREDPVPLKWIHEKRGAESIETVMLQ